MRTPITRSGWLTVSTRSCSHAGAAGPSLRLLVQVDTDGWDVEPNLWDAGETVYLLDRAQHVLASGSLKDAHEESALTRAAGSGELLAAVARCPYGRTNPPLPASIYCEDLHA